MGESISARQSDILMPEVAATATSFTHEEDLEDLGCNDLYAFLIRIHSKAVVALTNAYNKSRRPTPAIFSRIVLINTDIDASILPAIAPMNPFSIFLKF